MAAVSCLVSAFRLLLHRQHHGWFTIDRRITPLGLSALDNPRDLPEQDRAAWGGMYHDTAEGCRIPNQAEPTDKEFLGRIADEASGNTQVGVDQSLLDLCQGYFVRMHLVQVDQHLVLLAAAPHRDHLGDTAKRSQPLPDDPIRLGPKFQRIG
jgi:hypothetical protein